MHVYKADEFVKNSHCVHIFKHEDSSFCKSSEKIHTHDFIEIVYILSGEMTQIINDCSYDVCRGDLLFMNDGCTHSFSADKEYSYINIIFSPKLNGENMINPLNKFSMLALSCFNEMRGETAFGRICFFGKERDKIEDIICSMFHEYTKKEKSYEIVVENYLNTLLIKMLRERKVGIRPLEIDDTWKEISAYIDEHLADRITLEELANQYSYNPSYFSRVFKEKFGVTFLKYITGKRLDLAIKLLEETTITIDEISERVGFSDSNSLYHAFSRYLNTTPGQYRKGR